MKRGFEKRRKRKPSKKLWVKAIPSTNTAARDEGPRLIPLPPEKRQPLGIEHYLRLADIALGRKSKPR